MCPSYALHTGVHLAMAMTRMRQCFGVQAFMSLEKEEVERKNE